MASDLKTSLGIWAMGGMVTRFVPVGYQPEHNQETTAEKVHRAVQVLGELIDDYEFHYPQELSPDNLDEVRSALDGHGIYCVATGLHLDPLFGRGGLVSPDRRVREEAVRRTVEAADFAGSIGAHFIIWPGIEGYNYPFQQRYADAWARLIDGVGQAAEICAKHGVNGDAGGRVGAAPGRLWLGRRAPRPGPVPVHGGPGRRRAPQRPAVALH